VINRRRPLSRDAATIRRRFFDMLDHVFLPVSDIARAADFYQQALAPLGITDRLDYDSRQGPPGHPELKGFGAGGRMVLWLQEGEVAEHGAHLGFTAHSRRQVEAAYAAALQAGATDDGAPGTRRHHDPLHYAAKVLDPDGHSLEFVFKSWQHPLP
jgi:catechol 2,3-dioxygenase-like lactoylglutathione lyase family enzyme